MSSHLLIEMSDGHLASVKKSEIIDIVPPQTRNQLGKIRLTRNREVEVSEETDLRYVFEWVIETWEKWAQ